MWFLSSEVPFYHHSILPSHAHIILLYLFIPYIYILLIRQSPGGLQNNSMCVRIYWWKWKTTMKYKTIKSRKNHKHSSTLWKDFKHHERTLSIPFSASLSQRLYFHKIFVGSGFLTGPQPSQFTAAMPFRFCTHDILFSNQWRPSTCFSYVV